VLYEIAAAKSRRGRTNAGAGLAPHGAARWRAATFAKTKTPPVQLLKLEAGSRGSPHATRSFVVLVGRHGAMNPAGKVRCNMENQIRLANHNCNFYRLKARVFTGSKPAFCYPRLRS